MKCQNKFEALANVEDEDEDISEGVIETEIIENDELDIPRLPDKDEHGKRVDKRGIEKTEKKRRDRLAIDVGGDPTARGSNDDNP